MIRVHTDYPIAIDSPDHYCPHGTARDNSSNPLFNQKVYRLFKSLPRVLDLGCAGGGFVRSCLNDGCIAVGIEGSDFSKKNSRAEWANLGDVHLFTADITWPFEIRDGETLLQFDLITAWEVIEHLSEEHLPCFCENVKRHLLPGGFVIASISPNEEIIEGIRLHQTVKEQKWWEDLFASHGFRHLPELIPYFEGQFIRGPNQNAPGSFHLIMQTSETPRN